MNFPMFRGDTKIGPLMHCRTAADRDSTLNNRNMSDPRGHSVVGNLNFKVNLNYAEKTTRGSTCVAFRYPHRGTGLPTIVQVFIVLVLSKQYVN